MEDTMQKQTPEQARKIVGDLATQRDELEARKIILGQERDAVAFAAHTGNDKARTSLTRVNRELMETDYEIDSLTAAIAEAEEPAWAMPSSGISGPFAVYSCRIRLSCAKHHRANNLLWQMLRSGKCPGVNPSSSCWP
jgi:hypothetical protein